MDQPTLTPDGQQMPTAAQFEKLQPANFQAPKTAAEQEADLKKRQMAAQMLMQASQAAGQYRPSPISAGTPQQQLMPQQITSVNPMGQR